MQAAKQNSKSGVTLMSTVVAIALAGIVSMTVVRLLATQSKTMSMLKLREQREHLLKHYKNIVVSGWDATRSGCGSGSGVICSRTGNVIVPTANGSALYLADNLYDYNYTGGTSNRWWKVSINKIDANAGSIIQADRYVASEDLTAVKVKVEFKRSHHPLARIRLASREEIVFLDHSLTTATSDRPDCTTGLHPTQTKDGSGVKPLYAGTGALTQFDYRSNYAKCSQVPLVIEGSCPSGSGGTAGTFEEAIIGFKHRGQVQTNLSAVNHFAIPTTSGSSMPRSVGATYCDIRKGANNLC